MVFCMLLLVIPVAYPLLFVLLLVLHRRNPPLAEPFVTFLNTLLNAAIPVAPPFKLLAELRRRSRGRHTPRLTHRSITVRQPEAENFSS